MEYVKPGTMIIIMIQSELHDNFSLINATALLSFLKAVDSNINVPVYANSLGNLIFLYAHFQTLSDTQAVHTAKTNQQHGTHMQHTRLKQIQSKDEM